MAKCISVKCSVDSCEYWGKNNVCTADAIEVDNQAEIDMEIGRLGEGEAEAGTSKATYCRTYQPRVNPTK